MSAPTPLAVLIATAGRPQLLARTLASLTACRLPEGYEGTVVAENGARLGAEDVARRFDAIRTSYLFVAKPGKCPALNAALQSLRGRLVVFTDDDARFSPDALEAYARAAREAGSGRFFGGPVGVDYEHKPPPWLAPYLPPSARGWQPQSSTGAGGFRADFLGINWAAYADDVLAAGGFDETLGPGGVLGVGDETQMQRKLLIGGLSPCYVPDASVWHFVPAGRCTPEWSLERCRQHAAQMGRMLSGCGAPGAPWLDLAKAAARLAVQVLRPGAPAAFRARYLSRYAAGFWSGFMRSSSLRPTVGTP